MPFAGMQTLLSSYALKWRFLFKALLFVFGWQEPGPKTVKGDFTISEQSLGPENYHNNKYNGNQNLTGSVHGWNVKRTDT
jgi:hypothetical protein